MQARTGQRHGSKERTMQADSGLAVQAKPRLAGNAALLISLQRSHGNRFVQRMLDATVLQRACGRGGRCSSCANEISEQPSESNRLRGSVVQAKLAVSQPDDPYEQEADRVADQVLRKVATERLTRGGYDGDSRIQRAEDENPTGNPIVEQINAVLDRDGVQAKSEARGVNVSADFESRLADAKGSGSSIPQPVRAEMEDAFGADFSGVRLHTDPNAADMSRDIGAHAFTHGSDIYFNRGAFNPSTSEGKYLLAHELAHTIQQNGGEIRRLSITRNSRPEGHCGSR